MLANGIRLNRMNIYIYNFQFIIRNSQFVMLCDLLTPYTLRLTIKKEAVVTGAYSRTIER